MKSSREIYLILLSYLYVIKPKVVCDILTHSKECAILIENFATASADFMNCTVQSARPVQVCCSCAKKYNKVMENFDDIIKAQTNKNSTCDEKLLNQDRLAIIETTVNFYHELWLKGQCNNCLEDKIKPEKPSNTTNEFQKFYSDTKDCLSKLYNTSSKTYDKDVCQNCSTVYFKMKKFYSGLKETSGNGNICIDIVDAMNLTQRLWSNLLHCGKTVLTYEIPLISFCTITLVLPIIFYGWASKFGKAKSATVLRRNRLSQRFGERWRNRAGSSISN